MMEAVCPGWSDKTQALTDCEPTVKTVLSAETRLEKAGWRITGPDTVYRTQFGEFDLIHNSGSGPATWCPVTTRWDVVDVVDGTLRFHYQFPLAMCLVGVGFDCAYIYMVWKRRRAMRVQAAPASTTT